MTLGQALSVLVIACFVCFIVWGRTASGQALLTKVFGAPKPPVVRKPSAPTTKRRSPNAQRSSTKAADGAVSRSATGRGKKK